MPKLTDDRMLSCSQLPAIMGHSKWSQPNDVLEYAVKAINGEDPRTDAGEAADWGNKLEPAILAEMARRLGIDKWHSPDRAFKHPTLPLGASADAIAEPVEGTVIHHDPGAGIYVVDGDSIVLDGIGVLESKLTRGHPEDVLPLYRGPIQVQGVMMCTDAKWAAIGTLYSGVELRIFLFKPHAATQQAIRDATVDFEARLDDYQATGQMNWYPAADSDDANRIWPKARDEEIDLGDEAEVLASEIAALKADIKAAQDKITDKEKSLKVLMQEFSAARAGRWEIKWPMRHYSAVPQKITPAKEAYSIRQSTLTIKEAK
jgi:predicted phage-related endonuclease